MLNMSSTDVLVTPEYTQLLEQVKTELGLGNKPKAKISKKVRDILELKATVRLSDHRVTFFYDLEEGRAVPVNE